MNFPPSTTLPSPTTQPAAATQPGDRLRGNAFNVALDIPLVSPRPATPDGADVLLNTAGGSPGISRISRGKGKCYLLGFCLQDTSFQAWQTSDWASLQQLNDLLLAIANDAGVQSHVRSSNGDIEATVRAGAKEAFLFIIAHEPRTPEAQVWVRDLPFEMKTVTDLATDEQVPTQQDDGATRIDITAPTGTTKILHLQP